MVDMRFVGILSLFHFVVSVTSDMLPTTSFHIYQANVVCIRMKMEIFPMQSFVPCVVELNPCLCHMMPFLLHRFSDMYACVRKWSEKVCRYFGVNESEWFRESEKKRERRVDEENHLYSKRQGCFISHLSGT
uniref:Secreted protein n=1 Tax=Nelumbo nucifera TaxID=4432 RepID=A0A822ZF56_NELNU|nr:TPA_asm: hypothetical protein HUJ06_001422 [Nelumbo nucifera]